VSKTTYYLVIRADRTVRIAKRPRIMADEVAIRIELDFPAGWGRVLADPIFITAPDFTPEVIYEQTDENAGQP
jgi:hypothetical protein